MIFFSHDFIRENQTKNERSEEKIRIQAEKLLCCFHQKILFKNDF